MQEAIYRKVQNMIPNSGSFDSAYALFKEGRITEEEFLIWHDVRETK